MKVAIYSTKEFERSYLEAANIENHELVFLEASLGPSTCSLANGCTAVSIFTNDDASSVVLEKLRQMQVQYIAIRAAGYDQTDLNACRKLQMQAANVPEYSPYSIAEHTIAMILALNRKIVQADKKVKDQDFSLDDLIGFDLNGKTVGIIGLGRIGGIVSKILSGFGCRLLGYDVYENPALQEKYGLVYGSLEELLKQSDIITLHAPLTQESKYLINERSIGLMKRGVMIINTSRGGLLNTRAALEALKTGQIGTLGLDVYEKEKGLFFYDHRSDIPQDELFSSLLAFKNVLITGHQAFLTENALKNIAETTMYNLNCWAKNQNSSHELVK